MSTYSSAVHSYAPIEASLKNDIYKILGIEFAKHAGLLDHIDVTRVRVEIALDHISDAMVIRISYAQRLVSGARTVSLLNLHVSLSSLDKLNFGSSRVLKLITSRVPDIVPMLLLCAPSIDSTNENLARMRR